MSLAGKPVIAYTIGAAREAASLEQVIVSTNDQQIATVAAECGAKVVLRPDELARADSAIDDTYRHVIQYLEETEGFIPDIIVGMQANVPIRAKGEIDSVVHRLVDSPWATAVATGKRVSERPEWMKRIVDDATGEIAPINSPGERYRMQDLTELYLLDGATIAMRPDVLKRTAGDRRVHAYLGDKVLIYVHERCYAVEIDDKEDLELAVWHLKSSN
jgi:CMP-N-acetylneuraminic acid synthetase